jgi:hypothetical protein
MKASKMHYAKHFSSLEALQRYIDDTVRVWPYQESVTTKPEMSWDLNTDYSKSLLLARDGWQDGAQDFATGLDHLAPLYPTPEWTNDVAGYFPDVARFCAGMPDCMVTPYMPDNGQQPVVTLAISTAINSSGNAECMANYGTALARYVDELEASGTRVELVAGLCTTMNSHTIAFTWTVKRADDIMDLANVAFSIAHPAMLRRLGFALIERIPAEYGNSSGYGKARTLTASDLPDVFRDAAILTGMKQANSIARTVPDALAAIAKEIEALSELP